MHTEVRETRNKRWERKKERKTEKWERREEAKMGGTR